MQNTSIKRTVGRRPCSGKPKIDTRVDILSAARRIFARKGMEGASVREVAATAKVNTAMIYYHFKDKEGLYQAVLADSVSVLAGIWEDRVFKSNVPVKKKIQRYVELFIQYEQKNEDLRRIMAMEFAVSGRSAACICEQYFGDNYTRLIEIVKEGIKRGEMRKIDPSLAVSSLIGIIVHNFIMHPMAEKISGKRVDLSPKKFGSFITDLFFTGLMRE